MAKQLYFFWEENVLRRLKVDEILYLEVKGNYVKFYSLEYSHMVRISLDAALKLLPAGRFEKIHRSFAISVDHIEVITRKVVSFVPDAASATHDQMAPISKKFYAAFIKKIRILEPGSKASGINRSR